MKSNALQLGRLFCRNCSTVRITEKKLKHEIFKNTGVRSYAKGVKRFYKKTGILHSDGLYEINLDHRKVKTPKGNVLRLESEILAMMVATEWDAQKTEIQPASMHLTALCNTSIENPNNLVKEEAVEKLVNMLETDTILYHSQNEDILKLQRSEWDPIISWFCHRYDVDISATTDLLGPTISDNCKDIIRRHLLSYNMSCIHGFNLAVESLKSVILALSCVERRLPVEQAVLLSRLEEEFQAGRWGRVEWAHDFTQLDLQSRVAAGIVFIHVNSMSEDTKSKLGTKFN